MDRLREISYRYLRLPGPALHRKARLTAGSAPRNSEKSARLRDMLPVSYEALRPITTRCYGKQANRRCTAKTFRHLG